jgi:hypothetical protein
MHLGTSPGGALLEYVNPALKLMVTSLTDFVLAGEILFLAGMTVVRAKARYSAAWYWSVLLLLFGIAAMAGGIDHGFFEPAHLPRYAIQRFTWLLLAGMTFNLLMTASRQFLPSRVQPLLLCIALIQFFIAAIAILMVDSFVVIVANYIPVLLFFLILNQLHRRDGKRSRELTTGWGNLPLPGRLEANGLDARCRAWFIRSGVSGNHVATYA